MTDISTPTLSAGADKARPADRHVHVTGEAFQAVVRIRTQVQKQIRMRPDMSIVIAAMLQRAAELPDIADSVARYGLALNSMPDLGVSAPPAPAATP